MWIYCKIHTHHKPYSEREQHMDFSCLLLLSWHAPHVGSWLWISDRVSAVYNFSLQSCIQWIDEMVWTRLATQIDSAARLMKICSEHAGRQAVRYIGMCHNAWIQQQSSQPCALTSSLSCSVIPLCLHSSFCLSNYASTPHHPPPLACLFSLFHSRYVILL